MPKQYDWTEAIRFMTSEVETKDDLTYQILWRRLQNGDRTQDLLMTISALHDLKDDAVSKSPEWTDAIKWLNAQRAEQPENLKLKMLWSQLETGDRTEELLELIQDEMTSTPKTSKKKRSE